MQVKRIKCPNCNVVLDVKNSKGLPEMQISCPRCSTELLVKFKPQAAPVEAPTFYARPHGSADSGETQLGDNRSFETQLAGDGHNVGAVPTSRAVLVCGGNIYPLSEGRNVVGRKASTSKATVQIATDDHYMSRQHCVITVTTKADGTPKTVLSNFQNKNETAIDGHTIASGDAIILQDGNTITMGQTAVTYSITHFHD